MIVDEAEGVCACASCGCVLEEYDGLVHQGAFAEGPTGVFVSDHDTGECAAAMLSSLVRHEGGGPPTGALPRSWAVRRSARSRVALRRHADALRVPGHVADQSEALLLRVLCECYNPGVPQAVLLGAVLHLASRDSGAAVLLKDVAAVVDRSIFALSKESGRLRRALGMEVGQPSLVRLAQAAAGRLLSTLAHQLPPPAAQQPSTPSQHSSQPNHQSHPVYRSVAALAEVCQHHGIGEPHSPQARVAYLLHLAIKAHVGNGSTAVTTADAASAAGSSLDALYAAGRASGDGLLRLAVATPVGPHVTLNNIGRYAALLRSMTHAAAALQGQEQALRAS